MIYHKNEMIKVRKNEYEKNEKYFCRKTFAKLKKGFFYKNVSRETFFITKTGKKNNVFSKKLHKNKHFIKHYSLPTFLKS